MVDSAVPIGFVPGIATLASKESPWHCRDALRMIAGARSDGYRQPRHLHAESALSGH